MLEKEIVEDSVRYRIEKDGLIVIGLDEKLTKVTIPQRLEKNCILHIGQSAFARQEQLSKIIISEGIRTIGKYAFHECKGLKQITLPSSVREIASHAFYNCRNLVQISMSAEVEEIGDGAFKNCTGLEEIVLVVSERNIALSKMLPDIIKSITVVLLDAKAKLRKTKLVFPKDNMVVSDFSTRLYMDVQYGVGYHYRQVVSGSAIDYGRYDRLFSRAKNELEQRELIKIVLYRLCYPTELDEEAKAQYEEYVQEHTIAIWAELIEQQELELVECLLEHHHLKVDQIEEVLQIAYKTENVEIVGQLLNYKKRETTDRRSMTFDL